MKPYEQYFLISCTSGDLENVRHFLRNGIDIHLEGGQAFSNACESKNIELIDYLLSSPEIKEHSKINPELNNDLIQACFKGNKEVVEKLFSLPVFQQQKKNQPKKHEKLIIEAFKNACGSPKIEMIQFFTEELNLDDRKIVFHNLNRGLIAACNYGRLNNVKFLFQNEKTKNYINPIQYEEAALRISIHNKRIAILKYMMIEEKISISDDFKSWVQKMPEISSEIKDIFNNIINTHEVQDKLNEALPVKIETVIKKKKI